VSLRTFTAYAPLDGEKVAAPPTLLDNAYTVVITAATTVPAARAGRTVVAGTFPCFLIQTDNRGTERCRFKVTREAAVRLAQGTGERWYILAGPQASASQDHAFDVACADDPADRLLGW
jgi:hypothetical protein